MPDWLRIKNQSADKAEIYIEGDIVDDRWKGWAWAEDVETYPSDIRDMLNGLDGKDVTVYVNSGGGSFFAGIAINNMLRRHTGKTTGVVEGLAASAASIALFGCDEIKCPDNAYIMIHKPMLAMVGNADDFLEVAEVLEGLQRGMVNGYAHHAKEDVSEDTINGLINAETWINGKEAAEYFDLQVLPALDVVACTGDYLGKWERRPQGIEYNVVEDDTERLNQLIDIALATI